MYELCTPYCLAPGIIFRTGSTYRALRGPMNIWSDRTFSAHGSVWNTSMDGLLGAQGRLKPRSTIRIDQSQVQRRIVGVFKHKAGSREVGKFSDHICGDHVSNAYGVLGSCPGAKRPTVFMSWHSYSVIHEMTDNTVSDVQKGDGLLIEYDVPHYINKLD
jgi:hypothetical protein